MTSHSQQAPAALIFDMDGTLWDAVDSYVEVWHRSFAALGINAHVDRSMLLDQMGRHLEDIAVTLTPGVTDRSGLVEKVMEVERDIMPVLGGRLYDGVKTTMQQLHDRGHQLFMVSNCGEHGLDNFLTITGLKPLFTDWLSHGGTGEPKAVNISTLIERYKIERAVYVGDTQSDADSAHAAGIPVVWCRYGFGTMRDAEYAVGSFAEILNLSL